MTSLHSCVESMSRTTSTQMTSSPTPHAQPTASRPLSRYTVAAVRLCNLLDWRLVLSWTELKLFRALAPHYPHMFPPLAAFLRPVFQKVWFRSICSLVCNLPHCCLCALLPPACLLQQNLPAASCVYTLPGGHTFHLLLAQHPQGHSNYRSQSSVCNTAEMS